MVREEERFFFLGFVGFFVLSFGVVMAVNMVLGATGGVRGGRR